NSDQAVAFEDPCRCWAAPIEIDVTGAQLVEIADVAVRRHAPVAHQTQKGRQWYFGMKGHFGVDSQSKLIHSVEATPANIHDSHVRPWLLHGEERRVWGDSAYAGQAPSSACVRPTRATSPIVVPRRPSGARPIDGSRACGRASSIRSG